MSEINQIDFKPYEWELMNIIGDYESYGGNYGAFNRGGLDEGKIALGSGIDPNIPSMIISDIIYLQTAPEVPPPEWLHAVGKYQIIGITLMKLMNGEFGETGVTSDMPFSEKNQDKLFVALARNRIIDDDLQATISGLRQEWVGLQYVPDEILFPAVEDFQKSLAFLGDWITGGIGMDVLTGGTGADVFEMSQYGHDIVTNFEYDQSDVVSLFNFSGNVRITEYFSLNGIDTVIHAGENTMQFAGVPGWQIYDSVMDQDNIQLIATNFDSLSMC